jgi:Fe-S-cluster containining protein
MEIHFLPGQNYDCVRCGKSCRMWRIQSDPHTEERIAGSELAARRMEETGAPGVFTKHPENGSDLLTHHEGACIFLQEDNRCGVHAHLGATAKPAVCRQFPFLPVNTPDGIFVGISYYCTAAKANHGRPMDAHVWSLKEVLPLQRMRATGFEPQNLSAGSNAVMAWAVYRRLEERVREGGMARAVCALADLSVRVEGTVTREALEEAWTTAKPEMLVTDVGLQHWERLFVTTLLITLEVPDARFRRDAIQTFLAGGEIVLTPPGGTGTAFSLDQSIVEMPGWVEIELARYEAALLFRKFLALHRPLLDNAVVLYVTPRLFRLYAAISAAKRGAAEVEREDGDYALDRMELFLTHATNPALDRLMGEFAESFVKQMEAVRSGPAARVPVS